MPTVDEIKARYPAVADAVEYAETADVEPVWAEARDLGTSPAQVVLWFQVGGAIAVVSRFETLAEIPPETAALATRILDQMSHPDFLRYVAGKLGAI